MVERHGILDLPPQKMYGKDMTFKMSHLMTSECNLFEFCKEYCRPPLLLMT